MTKKTLRKIAIWSVGYSIREEMKPVHTLVARTTYEGKVTESSGVTIFVDGVEYVRQDYTDGCCNSLRKPYLKAMASECRYFKEIHTREVDA